MPHTHLNKYSSPFDNTPNFYQVVETLNPYSHNKQFLLKVLTLIPNVSKLLQKKLLEFKLRSNLSGYYLLRGLPRDPCLKHCAIPKVIQNLKRLKKTYYSEFWLSLVAFLLGEPFSYQQEGDGFLFHNICPELKHNQTLSSKSADLLLDFHTENAFHGFIPDFLLLFCLRQDRHQQAKTFIASIRKIIHRIPRSIKRILFKPWYKTGIDTSFGSPNGEKGNGPIVSVLSGQHNDPQIIFDPDLMLPLNKKALFALNYLKKSLLSVKESILLQPGDLLIIDNRRAVHGRNQFKAYFDNQDRWLQRCYVSKDISRAERLYPTNNRIINHRFF